MIRRALAWLDDRAGIVMIVMGLIALGSIVFWVNEVQSKTDCQADLLRGVSRIVALPASTDPEIRAQRGLEFTGLFRQYEEC